MHLKPIIHIPPNNGKDLIDFPNAFIKVLYDGVKSDPSWPFLKITQKTQNDSYENLHFETITIEKLWSIVRKLANYLHIKFKIPFVTHPSQQLVIALYGPTPVEYFYHQLAILYLGHVFFAVSTRNSPAAVIHLLTKTNTHRIIYWPSQTYQIDQVKAEIPNLHAVPVPIGTEWDAVMASEFSLPDQQNFMSLTNDMLNLPMAIYHSSGSTGFPKPIQIKGSGWRAFVNSSLDGWKDVNAGQHFLAVGPLFHVLGSLIITMALYTHNSVIIPPSCERLNSVVLRDIIKQAPPIIYTMLVPSLLKEVFEFDDGIQVLRKIGQIAVGGAPTPIEMGNAIKAAGINLTAAWGCTEGGGMGKGAWDEKDWKYIRFNRNMPYTLEPRDDEEGVYELILNTSETYAPNVNNRPDGSYATSDLWVPHPIKKGWYKFIGRNDDTLVLMNGEKTNPVPMETEILSSPLVQVAVIVGHEKERNGILVEPSNLALSQYPNPQELREEIWKIVQKANIPAPQHSQIHKDMIGLMPNGTKWPKVDKGSISRRKVYTKFANVIDKLYEEYDAKSGSTLEDLAGDSLQQTEHFIRSLVVDALGERNSMDLDDDSNVFDHGMDSLGATKIRNGILGAWKTNHENIEPKSKVIGLNVVFQYPTINKLANYVYSVVHGVRETREKSSEEIINSMIEKYRHQLVNHVYKPEEIIDDSDKKYVVITGTTGSLGNYLLLDYLALPEVKRVYALNRPAKGKTSVERLKETFKERFLDPSILDEAIQDGRLDVLDSSLGEVNLGLKWEKYNEIRQLVNLVIHNAWSVNFNKTIESFEKDCIFGSLQLMNMCISSPRKYPAEWHFMSSIATAMRWTNGIVPETPIVEPKYAQPTGYGQSKFVVERLSEIVATEKGLPVVVYRLGQLVGSRKEGAWNFTEHIPLVIGFAVREHVLPDLKEYKTTWVPSDVAAHSICEISQKFRNENEVHVYNLLNPITTQWSFIVDTLSLNGVNFNLVSVNEWLNILRQSDPNPEINPTIKLLSFYEGAFTGKDMIIPEFSTKAATRDSESLRNLKGTDVDLMKSFLHYWIRKGYIPSIEGQCKLSR